MTNCRILVVALLAVLAQPLPAWATCMTSCTADLMLASCQPPAPPDQWPAAQSLGFIAACETCCAAPGGPVNCNPQVLDATGVKVLAGAQPVAGTVAAAGALCGNQTRYEFSTKLQPGPHELVISNLIVASFVVTAGGGCATSTDCQACSNCEQGQCKPLACKATCSANADCGANAKCVQTVAGCCSECQAVAADVSTADTDKADAGTGDAASADSQSDSADSQSDSADSKSDSADSQSDWAETKMAETSADGGSVDGAAADVASADAGVAAVADVADAAPTPQPATSAAPSSGCQAQPVVPSQAWLALLALTAVVAARRVSGCRRA